MRIIHWICYGFPFLENFKTSRKTQYFGRQKAVCEKQYHFIRIVHKTPVLLFKELLNYLCPNWLFSQLIVDHQMIVYTNQSHSLAFIVETQFHDVAIKTPAQYLQLVLNGLTSLYTTNTGTIMMPPYSVREKPKVSKFCQAYQAENGPVGAACRAENI